MVESQQQQLLLLLGKSIQKGSRWEGSGGRCVFVRGQWIVKKIRRRAAAAAWYADDGWSHCGATDRPNQRTYLVKYGATAAASDRTGGARPGTRSERRNTLRARPRLLLIPMLVTVVVLRV